MQIICPTFTISLDMVDLFDGSNPLSSHNFKNSIQFDVRNLITNFIVLPIIHDYHNYTILRPTPINNANVISGTSDINELSQYVINTNCFNDYDQSVLNSIDPDVNYLSANNGSIDTNYFDEQSFRVKFRNDDKLSMRHLNLISLIVLHLSVVCVWI